MKKVNIVVWLSCIIFSCVTLLSCNNEVEPVKYKFSQLQFVVNVESKQDGTRANLHKQEWENGDKIIMAIGGIENNIAFLEYIGNGDWSVSELDDNSHFLGESGSLSAVYAEKLNYEAGNITTAGDVLYTQSGTYEIRDNIVSIRLNMNERPVGRIAIVGLLPTYWMEEMVEYTRLTSLTSMSWDTSVRSKGLNNRVIHGDTCVFYGILPSDNAGNTIINLINADGASHKRTYEGKQLQKGDYVILNGPGTDESTLWESNVPVKRIKAVNSSISIMVNDILQLKGCSIN